VASTRKILGVLAGEDVEKELLRAWAISADLVIAADRGADLLLDAGVRPNVVVGDMDSISEEASRGVEDVRISDDEATTDCDKLLSVASEMGADEITLIAIEGDLPDHALATLQSAARSCLQIRLAYRRGVGWIMRGPASLSVTTEIGRRVSFLPITECSGVSLSGVHWPLQDASMHPTGVTSISNRATEPILHAEVSSGAGLLFVEYTPHEVPFW
jgi:thiamine pyrophosphokinase